MRSAWRYLILGLAWVFVAIGIVGVVLPGLPGTIFLIMAAALFAKGSPRFEKWLLDHPRLGPPVANWRRTRAIPRRVKIVAVGSMIVSFILLVVASAPLVATLLGGAALAASAAYVATRPDA